MHQNMLQRKACSFIVKEKRYYVLIKDFNTFMYNHTLHSRRKHLYSYCLQIFSTEELLKRQRIVIPKKGECIKFKNLERKAKSPFMVFADFESILVLEDNGKQYPEEYYTNKYQKHVACTYGYKLVCVDDKF